ncbi:hypothetical protein C8Q79DRAFT_1000270 [Trametes meyenii]|nr:hypothetical protein C8Q79DRAFT_1000270 [Trametes meyenii]
MPSLRRTLSSPSVRCSPYSYSSAGGHQPRRSSGSETASRRVLADIDWWLVHDIERDVVASPSSGGENDSDEQGAAENVQVRHDGPQVLSEDDVPAVPHAAVVPPAPSFAVSAASSFEGELLSSPLWDVSTDDNSFGMSSPEPLSPLPQFATLSVGPRTPLRRHASMSSDSSVESTPGDSLYPLPTFMDVLRPAVPAYAPAFTTSLAPRRPTNSRAPALASRSVSYSAVEFQLSSSRFGDDRFGDLVPAPPPFFSNTMEDETDDLFY